MNRFWETVIEPALEIVQPRVIVEIGAEAGTNTARLLEFCVQHDAVLHAIDPMPKFDAESWRRQVEPRLKFHKARSLDALPGIGFADAVLIDGDHNWYTVHNELRLLGEAACAQCRSFPVTFLHDIGWPYGRRDLYYDPTTIPDEFRQPYLQRGMAPEESELQPTGGLNGHLFNATTEGGARNGVLTAIEDYLREQAPALEMVTIPGLQGLGIVFPTEPQETAEAMRAFSERLLGGGHAVPLVETIERDRIALQVQASAAKQAVADPGGEQDPFVAQIAKERELLRTELRCEREFLRSELESERNLLRSDVAAEREQMRAEAAAREQERVDQEREQLARFSASVDAALRREQEQAEIALVASLRLSQVVGSLDKLSDRLTSKRDIRLLESVRGQLASVIEGMSRGNEPTLVADPEIRPASSIEEYRKVVSGTPATPTPQALSPNGKAIKTDPGRVVTIDIIVCVHNALDDVERCLASIERHAESRHRVIIVDDGSDEVCAAYLRAFALRRPSSLLVRNESPMGYTKAANLGLRQSTAEVVILLNSDAILTANCIQRLVECAQSDPTIGIVGPLSNAASYQSVPELIDGKGDWSVNPAPPGWNIEQVSAAVALIAGRTYPRVPFVNGFCFAVKRAVIDAIGYFDEDAYPDGYGEENDYCLRAADAGFALAIADHAYVYHAKSRSYSDDRRRALGKDGRIALFQNHGSDRVRSAELRLRNDPDLARMRQALSVHLAEARPTPGISSVLFLLPTSGGGGGAHSIVQEASGMRQLGVDAQVAVLARHLQLYKSRYSTLDGVDRLFFGFSSHEELEAYAANFSVVVATIYTSVPMLATIAARQLATMPAYYIQDYEPFFFPDESPERAEAAASYTLMPNALLFAKTDWLRNLVQELHGVTVHKVSPSLDRAVFYPPANTRPHKRVRIAAMIRPRSARRGAPRTMEVLKQLTKELCKRVDVHIFGSADAEINAAGLPANFRFKNHGMLKREQVANLLRDSDIFIDLSDYQAFGRTGLEAMACGCAVVVPSLGGASEYAGHGDNALIVDTTDVDSCYEAVRQLAKDASLRNRLRKAGLSTAGDYSMAGAARSEVDLFSRFRSCKDHPMDLRVPAPQQETVNV